MINTKTILALLLASPTPLHRDDLARLLSCHPGTSTHWLSKLRRSGLVTREGAGYRATDAGRAKIETPAPSVPFDAEGDRLEELSFWSWLDIAGRGPQLQGVE